MKNYKLFTPITIGSNTFKNRIVMAPMTRCRAIGNIPNDLMAKYYQQRIMAGLIVTEGTSPSPNGLGYARIPGIFNEVQIEGWKKTCSLVNKGGGKIFVQLMHTGRISNALNMSVGSEIIAPSAIQAAGQMWTDIKQMQDHTMPKAMAAADMIAFGRPFINNPDLVTRMELDQKLSEDLKADLFYAADEKGYTDYPVYKAPVLLEVE